MEGYDSTNSSLIADIAQQSSIREHLIIVTNGCVDSGSIDLSDQKMKQHKIQFQFVSSFIIGDGGGLSVGAPYCRNCLNITYSIQKSNERVVQTYLSQEELIVLNGINAINTFDKFIQSYSNLENAIQVKTLGMLANLGLKTMIYKMKNQIEKNIVPNNQKEDFNKKTKVLLNMADRLLRNNFTLKSITAAKMKEIE